MKIGLLLPTNKPNVFNEVFLPSLHNIASAKSEIVLSINFQSPWTIDMINEAIKKIKNIGIDVVYSYNTYVSKDTGRIKFNKIRYDCAVPIANNVDIFALCDDDFRFDEECGNMLLNIIDYFENDASLGIIQCHKTHPIIPLSLITVDPTKHIYYTDNGFFFRKINDHIVFPNDALNNVGAGEEYIIGLSLSCLGYTTKIRTKSKITHLVNYANMKNNEWGTEEIIYSKYGNKTYILNKYGGNKNVEKNIF